MKLTAQKRLSACIMKCSPKRIKFDPKHLHDVKEAITKADLKSLINEKVITRVPVKGVSRVRARARAEQRRKGLQKGPGSKKAKPTATITKKASWIKKIRIQRSFLKELKEKGFLESKTYTNLYRKSKGGFFRSKRHIKL
ncbi:50S ribosomal protein L19e, partial [Candidatus Woesearchaeota archaeon]|nr:50S ribosomal protein L19e [Candidatus Woesearchaeota archaeon]